MNLTASEPDAQENAEPADHQTRLMQSMGFTQDDLAANREGRLSEIQHYNLQVRRQRSVMIGLALILVAAFVATLLIFLGGQDDGSVILVLIGIGVTICSAALTGVFARFWMRLTADISDGSVQEYSGKLERVVKPVNRRVVNYMIRVGAAEAFVSKEAFETFEHLLQYRIYRAPHTGALLSAERIEN